MCGAQTRSARDVHSSPVTLGGTSRRSAAPIASPAAHAIRPSLVAPPTLRDNVGDDSIGRRTGRAQPGDHTVNVGGCAILAHLPLPLEAIDLDLEADDRAGLLHDELLGRIAH